MASNPQPSGSFSLSLSLSLLFVNFSLFDFGLLCVCVCVCFLIFCFGLNWRLILLGGFDGLALRSEFLALISFIFYFFGLIIRGWAVFGC